jgi:glycerophosphoryl diester phosphodiesterase
MERTTTSPLRLPGEIKILAHRGLVSEFVPENTIKAFTDAVAAGADVIETDVQVSKDNVALVFHDSSLLRLAGLKKEVSELTVAELDQIDIGHGKRIPTLEQVLVAFPKVKFNLDIKSQKAVAPAAAIIEKLKAHNQVLISSFSESRRLSCLARLSKPVRTSAGVNKVLKLYLASILNSRSLFAQIAKGSDALQVPVRRGLIRFDSPRFISFSKSAGLELHYWTINNHVEMKRLVSLGADAIVTDHCDLALATLR